MFKNKHILLRHNKIMTIMKIMRLTSTNLMFVSDIKKLDKHISVFMFVWCYILLFLGHMMIYIQYR